jgi:hypothetical protein
MRTFHAAQPWPRITQLAGAASRSYVAVPFIGKESKELLPLARNSVLVTRFDKATLRQGGVCPDTIAQFIGSGVRVYQSDNLHAKVFVFPRRALIGSANCSLHSATKLVEACLESDDVDVVRDARKFVLGLVKVQAELTEDYVQAMKRYYRPPRFVALAPAEVPEGPKLWVVPLSYRDFNKTQETAATRAEARAKKLLTNKSAFEVDTCLIPLEYHERISTGDDVLQLIQGAPDDPLEAHSLGRVLEVLPIGGKSKEAVVSMERKKKLMYEELPDFGKRVGQPLGSWAKWATPHEIKDPSLSYAVRAAWQG